MESFDKVTVIHNVSQKTITLYLRYVNEKYSINRLFNFQRNISEETSKVLYRIGENISKIIFKKIKKKECPPNINIKLILKNNENQNGFEYDNIHIIDTFVNEAHRYLLRIGNKDYSFDVNPPLLLNLELPKKCIMAGYLIYPTKLDGINCDANKTQIKWFRSKEKFKNFENSKSSISKTLIWEEIGDGFKIVITNNEISRLIKVVGTPYCGDRKGLEFECITDALVSPGPGPCPFEERHIFTSEKLCDDYLRVVSYNILADMYADKDYSKYVLYPYCPHYALDIEYRKPLFIKEILGYNADLICLQEVDKKVFLGDLSPVLQQYGLDGIYCTKGGSSSTEGVATFYRKEKLTLKESCTFQLSEELETNIIFEDLLEKIKRSPALHRSIRKGTVLQVGIFTRNSCPAQILVCGVTHLYFEPYSDHIRLLQAGMCLTILRQILDLQKAQNSSNDVSLILCGDFNSVPENGVYRLMTSQIVDEDDPDWRSKQGEEVKKVSFSHDLEIGSAVGTPQYTNYISSFNGCLDYIFYQTDKFSVHKVIPFPSHDAVTKHKALPSVTFPSDHLALVAELKWKE